MKGASKERTTGERRKDRERDREGERQVFVPRNVARKNKRRKGREKARHTHRHRQAFSSLAASRTQSSRAKAEVAQGLQLPRPEPALPSPGQTQPSRPPPCSPFTWAAQVRGHFQFLNLWRDLGTCLHAPRLRGRHVLPRHGLLLSLGAQGRSIRKEACGGRAAQAGPATRGRWRPASPPCRSWGVPSPHPSRPGPTQTPHRFCSPPPCALRPLVGKLGRPLTALPHAPKGGPLLRGIRLHNLDRTSWQTTSLCPSCTAE